VDNLTSNPVYDILLSMGSHHPSAEVRAAVALKDRLNNETIEKLLSSNDQQVLKNLVKSAAFRDYADTALLEKLIMNDPDIAQTVAYTLEAFGKIDKKQILRRLESHDDPKVLYALAGSFSTPLTVKKRLSKHADPDIAFEAIDALKQ
jgi:hypothetical protein